MSETKYSAGEVEKKTLPNNVKYLTTIAIFLECITLGCVVNFYSPVLVDLKNKYDTDIESISRIFIAMTVGYLIGAFSGGQLFSRFLKRQYGVVIAFSGIAASVFLTPYCPSLLLLLLNCSLLGLFCGAYDTAQVVWMIEMWQSKAGPFIQAQHFCFAIGSNIPIVLVTPFLSQAKPLNVVNDAEIQIPEALVSEDSVAPSRLKIPFTIAAGLVICNVMYELLLITCYRYEKPAPEILAPNSNSKDEELEDSKNGAKSDSKMYRIKLILVSGLFMGFCVGMEASSMQFIPTLAQYGDLKLSEAQGAFVLSGLTVAFTIGRLLGIFITFKVSSHFILFFNLICVASGNLVLLLWSNDSYNLLYGGCIALGLGYSTMYASFYTFMSKHLVFTDQIGSMMLVCGSIVATAYPLIVGKYIEQNPVVLTYTNFLSVGVCTSAFTAAYFITRDSRKEKPSKV